MIRMIKLVLKLLIQYLGQPERKVGDENEWQCPHCQDTGRDNLKFNEIKGVLYCFANPEHSKAILSEIYKGNKHLLRKNHSEETKPILDTQNKFEYFFSDENQDRLSTYVLKHNIELLECASSLGFLFKKRGITKETVASCFLGRDKAKSRWVIPNFEYSCAEYYHNNILGLEYRPKDLSKKGLYREKDTPTGLAMINTYKPDMEALVIVEGYFDGYALWQYLNENEQIPNYHIVTPSNGVNSLLKYMPQIKLDKYRKCYLCIDNDDKSTPIAHKILEKYPMFERIVMPDGCKDFNEYLLQCSNLKI